MSVGFPGVSFFGFSDEPMCDTVLKKPRTEVL